MENNNKHLEKLQGPGISPLPFESIRLAGKEALDLVRNLVKKASESHHIDFALLSSCWKKRIATVNTAQFTLEASMSAKKSRYCR